MSGHRDNQRPRGTNRHDSSDELLHLGMTQFLLTSLTDSLAENREILVKLIDSINAIKSDQTSRICELEQRVAEIRKQHRNYNNLLVGNRGGDRVQQPRSDS